MLKEVYMYKRVVFWLEYVEGIELISYVKREDY